LCYCCEQGLNRSHLAWWRDGKLSKRPRLARRLFIRVLTAGSNVFDTHEFIAVMIARRPWDTKPLHLLRKRMIRSTRGNITIFKGPR
jgi:hypothetical protein